MTQPLQIAVDLGAGSGRVFLAGVGEGELLLEEVQRFHYPARPSGGRLRWDLPLILREIKSGLREAGVRARARGRPVRSLGVDGWGVDYGLIDSGGSLIEDPVCYRDPRTQGVMEEVFRRVPRAEMFERTGVQFLDFNTIFQLYAHTAAGLPDQAGRLLLVPDLIHYFLTGRAVTEYTNATTTQLVTAHRGTWDREMLERLGLPAPLLTEIVAAGTDLGPLRPDVADDLALPGVHVVAPATHDTGSAVAGTPLEEGWAYISSGTWSLVGVERAAPIINTEVAGHNFSNEGGAFGTTRLLKNVMGLWILESCRREWRAEGWEAGYDALLRQVEALGDAHDGLLFPDDPRFFNPPNMRAAIAVQLAETGQPAPLDPPSLAKVILDSLAFRYASVLRTIETLTGGTLRGLHIIGGGSQNLYLNRMTATLTGLPVRAGPVEATVTGNALVQAITGGRFPSLADARRHVAENLRLPEILPRPTPALEERARRYAALEARYLGAGVS
jgi:rhamnulokinase